MEANNNNITARKQVIANTERIVVKVGTRLLTDHNAIALLISQIAAMRKHGYKVLLVSSGAVGMGMRRLNLHKRPSQLSEIQALAAIGQSELMAHYETECEKHGFKSAQLLLTADGLRHRERHLNALNCLNSLLAYDILPIINENDSVSVDELKFGDNDVLAALVATMARAHLTIILTTEDGLREKVDDKLGKRISIVEKITDKLKSSASGTDNKTFSVGGMISKLRAAEIVTTAGECLWIADGRKKDILNSILESNDVGTLFLPRKKHRVESKKRWIKFFSKCSGKLFIDAGAVKAVKDNGKSLLPSGVTAVEGKFKRGDTLEICDRNGSVVGRGLCNFDSEECRRIIGLQSSEISKQLGRGADDEIIHRNYLVVIN